MDMGIDLPVWVLNLERDQERRLFMTQQLTALGIDYELIKAVDKNALTAQELDLYSKKESIKCVGRELTTGEIACALSHIKMWDRIFKEGRQEVLILEDDIRVGRALFDFMTNRHKILVEYDYINFSTNAPQAPFGPYITDIYRFSNHRSDAQSTCAYLITSTGAQKLLDKAYPVRWPADELTGRTYITTLRSYGVYPNVAVIDEEFASRIWEECTLPRPRYVPRLHNIKHTSRYWRHSLKQIIDVVRYGSVQY